MRSVADSGLGTTTYTYDAANNVVTAAYPNGVQATLNYDQLNRLTSLVTPTTGYLYQLGPTGNRTNATEITGRLINWSYDNIYRLTGEAISSAPSKANGTVGYVLDPVGNRLSANSTISGINSGAYSLNPDDQELIESLCLYLLCKAKCAALLLPSLAITLSVMVVMNILYAISTFFLQRSVPLTFTSITEQMASALLLAIGIAKGTNRGTGAGITASS